MNGTLIPATPGDEASALADLPAEIREALAAPGAVIMMASASQGPEPTSRLSHWRRNGRSVGVG